MISEKKVMQAYDDGNPRYERCNIPADFQRFEEYVLGVLMKNGIMQTTYPQRKRTMATFQAIYDDERIMGIKFFEKNEKPRRFILIEDPRDETGYVRLELPTFHLIDVG